MKIPLKAKVICKDGEFGSVKELLIDPLKERVTHIVIENKHKGLQMIVPTDILDYSTDSVVTIDKTAVELDNYPPFLVHEFINVPANDANFAYWGADPTMTHSYTMFPYVMHEGSPVVEVTREDIPTGEFKLKKGMAVTNRSGKTLGHVDELIVDEVNEFISHIVMRTGHIFGTKEVVVPNINIVSFDKSAVVLSIDEDEIDSLPEVIIKRAWK